TLSLHDALPISFSHVACHPALDADEARELIDEISGTLRELLEEEPEAAELLRGRTLARSLHCSACCSRSSRSARSARRRRRPWSGRCCWSPRLTWRAPTPAP